MAGKRRYDGDAELPDELFLVRRDDDLLDALAAGQMPAGLDPDEQELAELLGAWRADALATPLPTTPTVADVTAASRVAQRKASRRRLQIISGAAVVVLGFGGVTAAAHNASPGSPLWGVKQVIFGDQAKSTEASDAIEADLDAATKALGDRDYEGVRTYLGRATERLPEIADNQRRAGYEQRIAAIAAQIPQPGGDLGTGPQPSDTTEPPSDVATSSPTPVTTTTTEPSAPPSESSSPSSSSPSSADPSSSEPSGSVEPPAAPSSAAP